MLQEKNNDEIDLIELMRVLWDKKIWIVLSTFLFVLIAGIYTSFVKEQWTSKAEVIEPRLTDFKDYLSLRQEFARILGIEFNADDLSKGLYDRFNLVSESLDERRNFFMQYNGNRKISTGQDTQTRHPIGSSIDKISVVKADPKKDPETTWRKISFSAENAAEAKNGLEQFIAYSNQVAYRREVEDFIIDFEMALSDLKYEKTKIEKDFAIQRKIQLENLTHALDIAKSAEIKESKLPVINKTTLQVVSMAEAEAEAEAQVDIKRVNKKTNKKVKSPSFESKPNDDIYLFMLGEKYLQAQIDLVNKKEIIYPARYYEISELLEELQTLFIKAKDTRANTFSYQSLPDYPVSKDKPKTAIILLLSAFIGLLLSSFIIIIRNLFITTKN